MTKPMFIILGGTGHVGSALADALLTGGEQPVIISRGTQKAGIWKEKGAQLVVADVYDTEKLHAVFSRGKRLFLLNPPADPSTDTASEERKTLASILKALDGSGIEKVVAESTYGAQPGDKIGDLGVLYEMEQALAAQPIPASIIRGAYYMSNWDAALQTAEKDGKLYTFYPSDFKIPMVAPCDIGQLAAKLITEPVENTGLYYIEGPKAYSSADVAAAFATALKKPVQTVEIPQSEQEQVMKDMGFSAKAAESFSKMTEITLEKAERPKSLVRGSTSLEDYIDDLVRKNQKSERNPSQKK